ncbi:peptide chain release factor N(5)-glutamine methyltransferase [Phyllobacterium sp. 628]|uniref:peptide chain release factor N(5)-glutamine methyltransferase n=1 Tax=Phyllobacterium sp. 628 TaxID=2718938 RepID=UPI0016622E0B|nr:peptide chain release factor N(5)-glutamine methyltransferase [Phyllobacterium sp. 628]QND50707.1 peptide chain release factor N(5)-glutamine methyltransferase [Phyllobacterium sp. 628]
MVDLGSRLADVHIQARTLLVKAEIETADLDARLLVEWVTGFDRLAMVRNPSIMIANDVSARLDAVLVRRINGESVHRIIGKREFFGLEFTLSPDTLEPRPDTEALVELALPFLRQRIAANGIADLIDLGTGTGAIAIALLNQLPELRAIGVDIAPGALATARDNAHINYVSSRFAALHSNWFAEVTGGFDMIISNPPYIRSKDIADLQREVAVHDPARALDGGPDGLDPYHIIADHAGDHLRRDGAVAVEVGFDQRNDVEAIFARSGFTLTGLQKDIAGHERAMLFMKT